MYIWISRLTGDASAAKPLGTGWVLPADRAAVPARDRGFLLGDGLFETIRLAGGRFPLLPRHLARLEIGCGLLGLKPPPGLDEILSNLAKTTASEGVTDGYARLTLSRGTGPRGYDPSPESRPFCAIEVGPWTPAEPRAWFAAVSRVPVVPHPLLSRCKHTSALPKVMARAEARAAGADEILFLTPDGRLIEGAATNLFWVKEGRIFTPSLETGCLPGVARGWLLDWARSRKLETAEGEFFLTDLNEADEVFLTNALLGPVPLAGIDDVGRWKAPGRLTADIAIAWRGLMSSL